jgi:Reverse transcriptase (RNA-dependent DNA polymerase)
MLYHLRNQSLESGVFPVSQKQAIVFPVLKKPTLDSDCTSSYRPASNLTFAAKVLERVVTKRLVAHAKSFHLFPNIQSAYRCHYSTETAVLSVHNDIVRAIDHCLVTGLLLLNLSSAFDTVDHSVLLSLLNK